MKTLLALISLACVVCLSSCNTAIGFGRDMREVGVGLENKAHGREWNGSGGQDQNGGNLPAY
jgi:predicted small secreted protein